MQTEPLKSCACGQTYTGPRWKGLVFVGYMAGDGGDLELRNCDCGSTLAVRAPKGTRIFRYSFAIHDPGGSLHEEETIIRATSQEEARALATMRAEAWSVDLRFIGVRHGNRLEVQVPRDQLPASWRDAA